MKKMILIFGFFIYGSSFGQKVKVLNFATFHMVYTPDEHKVKFDQNDEKSKSETFEIAKMLAEFKPTVICVEIVPGKSEGLNTDYSNFLKNKDYKTKIGGEVALIAYEVGKISGVKKIYGIDEQETAPYNYKIGSELENQVDSLTSKKYSRAVFKEFAEFGKLSTLGKLKTFNDKETLEKFININADILTYNSTKGNFEGADEASKFYRRNLRIFSNINQIPLTNEDRVFIIMGATHTAFLGEFMKRSPKYELVNVADYLK
ncbi:DUF5694 domain-containing protein [Pedobacter gandavensis]|uniref:DUF5694 domain-containing protein n=1 Tax=Pedobacter gandavensis TaxID=2679963 RepID=UPI00292D481A|nr:DUF5694 domain-containing protein [Pedobacter gandavensis]